MTPSLVTVGAFVVTGIGVITSLLTSQQGGDKGPPKWLDKVKGEKGVMILNTNGQSSGENICEGVKAVVEGGGRSILKSDKKTTLEDCNKLKGRDVDKKNEEIYFGLYFENKNGEKNCGGLEERENVVIYVEKENKASYGGSGFNDWSEGGSCKVENGDGENEFLVGRREDLINLWLSKGSAAMIIPYLILLFVKK